LNYWTINWNSKKF